MIKRILVVFFLLQAVNGLYAQQSKINYDDMFWPFNILREEVYNKTPYRAVRLLEEADTSGILQKDIYLQALMTAYSLCGEVEKKNELGFQRARPYMQSSVKEKFSFPAHVNMRNAKREILRLAKSESVLMINEAHMYPQHRVLMKSLLPELYTLGYRCLCMEDLVDAVILEKSKERRPLYPSMNMGFYINEPCMAELIREALRIGFTLHGYDGIDSANRDSTAARNLIGVQKEYPDGKLLVFCGHGHNMEYSTSQSWKVLASWYKEFTGVDPLTIDQTTFCEAVYSDLYDQILSDYVIKEPSILFYQDTAYMPRAKVCDYHVVSPRTSYIKGRPDWLLSGDNRILMPVKTDLNTASGIWIAYYEDEADYEDSIPVDIVISKDISNGVPPLCLPPNNSFRLKHYDVDYNLLEEYKLSTY